MNFKQFLVAEIYNALDDSLQENNFENLVKIFIHIMQEENDNTVKNIIPQIRRLRPEQWRQIFDIGELNQDLPMTRNVTAWSHMFIFSHGDDYVRQGIQVPRQSVPILDKLYSKISYMPVRPSRGHRNPPTRGQLLYNFRNALLLLRNSLRDGKPFIMDSICQHIARNPDLYIQAWRGGNGSSSPQ